MLMVEENEVRSNLSAWERSAIALRAIGTEDIDTIDKAIETLFPNADRFKKRRVRLIAEVVEELDGILIDPEGHTENALTRLAALIRSEWTPLIIDTLEQSSAKDHRAQWKALKTLILEYEGLSAEARSTPNSPRRQVDFKLGDRTLNMRREKTKFGYSLHISGPGASDRIVEEILEQIIFLAGADS